MTTHRRSLGILNAAFVAVVLAAMFSPTEPAPIASPTEGRCHAQWCQPGAVIEAAQLLIDEQLADVTAGRDCWAPGTRTTVPEQVVVKGSERDRSVVWVLSVDQAYALNRNGDSWDDVTVLAACAAG
jgi:mannose/cellobiose epimerase-like protein (N-acyl-D-glucosamine 2-epimerase family)